MRPFQFIFSVISIIFFFCGCGHMNFSERSATQEQAKLQNIDQKLYLERNFSQALQEYQNFQKIYPHSDLILKARLGEALALEALEKYADALEIYLEIKPTALARRDNEILNTADYHASLCLEVLGEHLKALGLLKDMELREEELSDEMAWVQLPARLATIYSKLDQPLISKQYLEKAKENLDQLIQRKSLSPNYIGLAKIYYEMGFVTTENLNTENDSQNFQALQSMQKFLLRALDTNDLYWSFMAQELLKKNYQNLWIYLEKYKTPSAISIYSQLSTEAEIQRPVSSVLMNVFQKDFYSFLTEMNKKVQPLLYSNKANTNLTSESEKINSIKRPGRTKVDILLPEEKKPKQKSGKVKDPNL